MSSVVVRAARAGDGRRLHEGLREEERQELRLGGHNPLAACVHSLSVGQAYVVEDGPEGALICAFGVCGVSLLSGIGAVWMLSTPRLAEYQARLFPVARGFLWHFARHYPWLVNAIWEGNRAALVLTRRLGFHHEPPVRFGPQGALFIPISWRASDV